MKRLALLCLLLAACGKDTTAPPVSARYCVTALDYRDAYHDSTTTQVIVSIPDSLYGALCVTLDDTLAVFADRGEGFYVYVRGERDGQPIEGWVTAWNPGVAVGARMTATGDTVVFSEWTAESWLARQAFVWSGNVLTGAEEYDNGTTLAYHIFTRWSKS